MTIERIDFVEDLQESRDILGSASMNDVEIGRQQRRALQDAGRHAHDDELDVVTGQGLEEVNEPDALRCH